MYTQVVIFRLKEAVSRQDFLEASGRMFCWLKRCPGFMDYALYEGEEAWCDTVLWNSRDDAERGMRAFYEAGISKEIVDLVESGFTAFFGTPVALSAGEQAASLIARIDQ